MNVKKIISQISLIPKKSLGQNFLINPRIALEIFQNFDFQKTDNILEIGPGLGAITEHLVVARTLVLVEKEDKLLTFLKSNFNSCSNIVFYNQDILKFDFQNLNNNNAKFKVISNLPYSVATKILKLCLTKKLFLSSLYFSFPKAIAEKIVAQPGSKKYGSLSVFVNFFSQVQTSIHLKADYFYPKPKIESVFLSFRLKNKNLIERSDKKQHFFQFINNCFFFKRKTLINNLKRTYDLSDIKLKAFSEFLKKTYGSYQIRAEICTLDDFYLFFQFLELDSVIDG